MCTGANCNDTLQVNIPTAVPGADGASAYVYIASADTNTGSNFSYPQDETQPYVAIITRTSPLVTPVVGDFTGNWRKVNGTDGAAGTPGTNGVDGISSGLPYNFLNYALTGNPANGNLSLSGADSSTTNTISISYTTLATGNIQALLAALNTSGSSLKAFIKLTKKGDETKFVVYSLNTATDTGVYYTLSVNYLASSTASPFVAGDDLYIEFYLTGDKGDKGDPGATGAFIIGTIGSGTQAYPTTANYGAAYRFTGSGTISDSAAGVLNVKRFFTGDILYCITDTTSSDGTKWTIWTGFPRPFYPGSGTDAFILNTSLGGTASGIQSIAAKGSTVSGDYTMGLGRGSTVAATDALDFGVSNTNAGNQSLSGGVGNSIGAGALYCAVVGSNNTIGAGSVGCTVFGRDNTLGASCIFNDVHGDYNTVDAGIQYSKVRGTGVKCSISNAEVRGAGTWSSGGTRGQKQTYNFPLSAVVPAGDGVTGVSDSLGTMEGGGTSTFVMPTDTTWLVKGRVASVINSGVNVDSLKIWDFSFQVTNLGGTAALKGNIICQIDDGSTTVVSALNTALDARIADGTNGSILKIVGSGANITFAVVGDISTTDPTLWSGQVEIVQIGWF